MSLARFNYRWAYGFPNPTLAGSDSISVFLLGDLSLLPPLAHYLFISDFSQDLLVLCPCFSQKIQVSCWLLLLEFLQCQDELFLSLKPRAVILQFVLFPPLWILNSTFSWSRQLRLSLTFKSTRRLWSFQRPDRLRLFLLWKRDSNAGTNGQYTGKGLRCFAIIIKSCLYFFISLEMLSLLGHTK